MRRTASCIGFFHAAPAAGTRRATRRTATPELAARPAAQRTRPATLFAPPPELFSRRPERSTRRAEQMARPPELFARRAEQVSSTRRAFSSARRAIFPTRRIICPGVAVRFAGASPCGRRSVRQRFGRHGPVHAHGGIRRVLADDCLCTLDDDRATCGRAGAGGGFRRSARLFCARTISRKCLCPHRTRPEVCRHQTIRRGIA